MFQTSVRVNHDCPYSRIASLFDTPVYEFCSDLYDLLIVPQSISEDKLQRITTEIREPDSLEVYTPEFNRKLTYLYFNCMCNRDINVVPTIERHGGMVQYPIRYENGYEYYRIISLNSKTQASVIGSLDHLDTAEVTEIVEMGKEDVFLSQFLPVSQLIQSLTDRQIEVITRAYQRGYYQIPRNTRTQDLADEFEVSRAATEKSLRKAENQILENVIPYLLMHQKLYNPHLRQ